MNYLIWLLIIYGITTLITRAHIFSWWRRLFSSRREAIYKTEYLSLWNKFWRCHWCVGFWVGFAMWWTSYGITNCPFFEGVLGSSVNILMFPLTFLSLWTEAKAE